MKKTLKLIRIALIASLMLNVACSTSEQNLTITNIRCEYLVQPIGIDVQLPRFTWEYGKTTHNFIQKAYQIRVASTAQLLEEGNADVWVSDKIMDNFPRAEYSGNKSLLPHARYYWNVTVWDNKGNSIISPTSWFEMGKISPDNWAGQWITDNHDKEFEPAPLFRKEFVAAKKIKYAATYISSTGYYEMFINNKRVGKNFLDPGYTHYDKRVLYTTHDVTSLLQEGNNAVALALGNGFYNCQSRAVWDFEKARWRNRPSLLCEIRIVYADGNTDIIASNDTWKTQTGPYIYNNIYSGDKYDARLEETGWKKAGFDDTQWANSRITESPAPLIVAQQMPSIRITKELTPMSVTSFGDRIYVYDLGENIAGVCKLKVKGEKGTTFTLKHGELLKENGRLEQGNIDIYYRPEKPGEMFQTDIFMLAGNDEEEIFVPQFTYHGFQYVEVECDRPVTLTKENLTGLFFHTDIQQIGQFSCSNPLLNKIWAATNQSYRGNIHSIPTDCPQREKNGWTADAHVTIDLALLNFDGITFYEKWMNDFIDNQRPNGGISGIIPTDTWGYGQWPGPVWDAALFVIPHALYNYYGEKRCIEQLYPTMQKYLNYLKAQEDENGLVTFGIGDWLSYSAHTPTDFTSSLYYYLDYKLMSHFATLLGKDTTPYIDKAEQLRETINKKYYDPETGLYANGTQTAQALPLYLKVVPKGEEQRVVDNLFKMVAENKYFLDFGLLGSKTVLPMLTKYGYVDAAYKMATKTEAPSWGYWVETKGYTTLAETWVMSPEFRDASINHVFMGEISTWMYNALAGINFEKTKPGFEHIIIKPYFIEDLQWVKGAYNSIWGPIKSEWKREGNRIELSVQIPAGTTATIYADKEYSVGSGVYSYSWKVQ